MCMLFAQPSFPSSGRGWTQKLIFNILKAAGAGVINTTLSVRYANSIITLGDEKVDWMFSHEGDKVIENLMRSSTIHPERPHVIFRVVRNALDNVEANYRYEKKESGKDLNFNAFASQKLVRYKGFHKYWDNKCKR